MNKADKVYAYEGDGPYEFHIVGTAEGLSRLREHLEQAIQAGEAEISEANIYWAGVVRLDGIPKAEEEAQTGWLSQLGCISLLIVPIVLMVLGCFKIWDLLVN